MALFPREGGVNELAEAPQRMWWTRELGTRKLVMGFVAIAGLLLLIWLVRDYLLLRTHWPDQVADPDGLTVVGTLDSRESYDRNLFRIVQAEGQARAELTSWGWESIFREENGKLCSDHDANTIRGVINVDSEIGYAMLEPYLRVAANKEMNRKDSFASITPETTISFTEENHKAGFPKEKTLGTLLEYYSRQGLRPDQKETTVSEGGSGSEHEVDHGLTIPGGNLIFACPVVLVGRHFTGGWVQEHPVSILGGKSYSVHLEMTPEGRSRFYQWSRYHAHESLVFVLKKQVVAAGRIAQTMDVSDWEITNIKDPEAANSLVEYVRQNASKSK